MPLTTLPVFPYLVGIAWPSKSPKFQTRTQRSVSGRQLRIVDQAYPIWQFTVPFEFLRDGNDTRQALGPGYGKNELRTLAGFYLRMYGAQGVFAYDDPSDDAVTGISPATGVTLINPNGVATQFQLFRKLVAGSAELAEPITAPNTVSHVYVNGVDPGGWSVNSAGIVTMASAPANGTVLTWTGTFYFPCHFVDDSIDLSNFMYQLWETKEIKFESVLP